MNLDFDFTEIERKLVDPLRSSPQRLKNAVASALTLTAVAARDAERREMRDVFDRPTPYTLGSLFVKPATGDQAAPEALMGIKDNVGGSRPAMSWLRWQIRGGLRSQTAFERKLVIAGAMRDDQRLVPGKFARLDAFGNVSRGQLVQILSQLRIDSTVGSTRSLPRVLPGDNEATRRAKQGTIRRAYNRAGGQYLALPNGRGRLAPGIYQVRQFGQGRSDPRPVLVFVSKAQYEARRFDFWYVAELALRRELPRHLAGRLALALLRREQGPGVRVLLA